MKTQARVLWALGIVILDTCIIVVPVFSLVLGYIILARPEWFQNWVKQIYE